MNTLKFIGLTIVQLAKQLWGLPHAISHAAENRRELAAHNQSEAERLDRIRNPSKYRCR